MRGLVLAWPVREDRFLTQPLVPIPVSWLFNDGDDDDDDDDVRIPGHLLALDRHPDRSHGPAAAPGHPTQHALPRPAIPGAAVRLVLPARAERHHRWLAPQSRLAARRSTGEQALLPVLYPDSVRWSGFQSLFVLI